MDGCVPSAREHCIALVTLAMYITLRTPRQIGETFTKPTEAYHEVIGFCGQSCTRDILWKKCSLLGTEAFFVSLATGSVPHASDKLV